jgi:hypothetical protein
VIDFINENFPLAKFDWEICRYKSNSLVHGWFLDEVYKFSIAPRNKGGVF